MSAARVGEVPSMGVVVWPSKVRVNVPVPAPMVSFWISGIESKIGRHVFPPSTVFQTPPLAVATYMMFGSRGSATVALMRPAVFWLFGVGPFSIGAGPTWNHCDGTLGV